MSGYFLASSSICVPYSLAEITLPSNLFTENDFLEKNKSQTLDETNHLSDIYFDNNSSGKRGAIKDVKGVCADHWR